MSVGRILTRFLGDACSPLRSTTAAFIAPTPASRLIARSGRWGTRGAEAWRPNAKQTPGENRWCKFQVGDSPQAFPLADPGRLAAYQGDGHSAGRSSDDYTLDTLPEEMADGDPQMAECLWRSTLSRGPSRHGRCRRDPLRCFALSMRVEAMKRRSRASGK